MGRKVGVIGILRFPLDLHYSHHKRGHNWIAKLPNGNVKIGLDHLGALPMIRVHDPHPVPFSVELPPAGTVLTQDGPYGLLETVKYIGPFFAPISGTIIETNEERISSPPHAINDPYVDGWFLIMKPTNIEQEVKNLITGEVFIKWATQDIIENVENDEILDAAKQGYKIMEE
jgi:glycine cleavage system H protein